MSSVCEPLDCAVGPFVPQAVQIPGRGGHKYGCCCSLDQSPCLFGLNGQKYRGDEASVSKFLVNK